MTHNSKHKTVPFSVNRRLVAASATIGRESNTIHTLTEVDISQARKLIRQHRARTGESLSITAYVVKCLALPAEGFPTLNSFRRGRKQILLEDLTVNTLVERDLGSESVPEPLPIRSVQNKSYREVHNELRAAQKHSSDHLGTLSKSPWFLQFLPERPARWFMRFAARSTTMAKHYGVLAVTAIGMHGTGASWGIPLTAATVTVTVTVGGIAPRPVLINGELEEREHLCLTVSFDHDIVDGAPGARFLKAFGEILRSGDCIRETVRNGASAT